MLTGLTVNNSSHDSSRTLLHECVMVEQWIHLSGSSIQPFAPTHIPFTLAYANAHAHWKQLWWCISVYNFYPHNVFLFLSFNEHGSAFHVFIFHMYLERTDKYLHTLSIQNILQSCKCVFVRTLSVISFVNTIVSLMWYIYNISE